MTNHDNVDRDSKGAGPLFYHFINLYPQSPSQPIQVYGTFPKWFAAEENDRSPRAARPHREKNREEETLRPKIPSFPFRINGPWKSLGEVKACLVRKYFRIELDRIPLGDKLWKPQINRDRLRTVFARNPR